MHAVIRTGGKQYRVTLGQQVRVDRLAGAAGDVVDLTDVLLLSDEDSTTLGTPTVENAHVVASIVEQVRGRKILVFKYKSKKRYRKLRGHRQRHTDLRIEEIVGPDGASYKHEKRERIPEVTKEEAEDEEDAAVDKASGDDVTVDEADVDEAPVDEAEEEATEDETALDEAAVDEAEDEAADDEASADESDEAADDSEAEEDEED